MKDRKNFDNIINSELKQHKPRLSKSLGQNLFVNKSLAEKVIEELALEKEDNIIEIGPGEGFFSNIIAEKVNSITVIEKDYEMINVLKQNLSKFKNVNIINKDFIKADLNIYENHKVFGSIPYNITSLILKKLMESADILSRILLIMQYEVAKKLTAPVGSKNYGSLTIVLNYYFNIKMIRKIKKANFRPIPKVDSAALLLIPSDKRIKDKKEEKIFFNIVKSAFLYRRKTLINSLSLSSNFQSEIDNIKYFILDNNIKLTARPQEFSLEQYKKLARFIYGVRPSNFDF